MTAKRRQDEAQKPVRKAHLLSPSICELNAMHESFYDRTIELLLECNVLCVGEHL